MSITATVKDITQEAGIIKVVVDYDDGDSRTWTYGSGCSFEQLQYDISQSLQAKLSVGFKIQEMQQYIGLTLSLDTPGNSVAIAINPLPIDPVKQ